MVAVAIPSPIPDVDVQTVAAYLRVSTGHQTELNQRPQVEQLIAARFARAKVMFYAERISAAKKRPEYERMLHDAKAGKFQVLIVWAVDRFGRSMAGNLNDVLALDAAGVRVVSCRESWLDMQGPFRNLLLAIFSWAAEQERRRIAERISAGVARIREHDGSLGRAGFGLKRVREAMRGVPRGVPRVALDEAAGPTLLRMAQLVVEAESLRGAALRLQAEGAMPPTKGNTWDHVSVKRILKNADLRRLGAWRADLLAQVDAVLSTRRRTPRGAAAPAHISSRYLACGSCGASLTVVGSKHGGASYVCGRCNQKGKAACPGVGHRAEAIVDRGLIAVVRRAIDGDIKARPPDRPEATRRPAAAGLRAKRWPMPSAKPGLLR